VLAKQVQIKKKDLACDWSLEGIDFANQLIQRKPQSRLGFNGPEEVMAHVWFRDINWSRLRKKQMKAPFSPSYNADEYQELHTVQEPPIPSETALLLKKEVIQSTPPPMQTCSWSTTTTGRKCKTLCCEADVLTLTKRLLFIGNESQEVQLLRRGTLLGLRVRVSA
jgi:hypothetical protein